MVIVQHADRMLRVQQQSWATETESAGFCWEPGVAEGQQAGRGGWSYLLPGVEPVSIRLLRAGAKLGRRPRRRK